MRPDENYLVRSGEGYKFFEYMHSGVTRHVFLIGRYAIKIPNMQSWSQFLSGLLANKQEKNWSGSSPKLCPVIFYVPGGFFSVMPRAKPFFGTLPKPWFESWVKVYGYTLPVEHKVNSVGFLDGNLVAVDYGS